MRKKNILTSFSIFLSLFFLYTPLARTATVDTDQYKGKVVYLDFWASWCTPCKESFPWLNKVNSEYKDLKIIAVNLDKERALAEEFLRENPARFEIHFDPEAESAKKYNIKGMPYSVLIDKNGKIRYTHIGFSKEKANDYKKEIQSLLEEKN